MKKSKQVRVTRELASSLLNSNLTEGELVELCESILSNDSVLNGVAESILNLLEPIARNTEVSSRRDELRLKASNAYNWLKRKGITKEKLFIAFTMFNREMAKFIHIEKPTIQEAMEHFIEQVSENEFHHFMMSFDDDKFIQMIEDN